MCTKKEPASIEILGCIREIVLDKKGENPIALHLKELSSITDYFLIVTANSKPHLKSLSENINVGLKKRQIHCYRKAGSPESGWIILDYIDVVIHLLTAEMRSFYALEQLWNDAQVVSFK